MGMTLRIKNMVCDRCKMVVRDTLERQGLVVLDVRLGEADLAPVTGMAGQLQQIRDRLQDLGFELIDDRKARVLEQIRTAIIGLVHHGNEEQKVKYSEYLSRQLQLDYSYLSKTFSEEEGVTIEQYIIYQKIERVKELLSYGELTLSEIAWQMGYSSVAALSSQFKKVTGMTPSTYKSTTVKDRIPLDRINPKGK